MEFKGKKWLEESGYDGLYCVAGDPCGCENRDIAPCGEGPSSECKPGYKYFDPRKGKEGRWAIFGQKGKPGLEEWESIDY